MQYYDKLTYINVSITVQLGCGSSLPSLFLLSHSQSNRVDVQDYNDQVIRYITIPNILLNTVLTVQENSGTTSSGDQIETNEYSEDEDEDDEDEDEDEEDEDEKRIEEDVDTCDAEAEITTEKIPDMLNQIQSRTRAFVGDWSSLAVSTKNGNIHWVTQNHLFIFRTS